jgi:hypothetical protein
MSLNMINAAFNSITAGYANPAMNISHIHNITGFIWTAEKFMDTVMAW